ncbi:MAG: DNA mismatch repair protein MutS [Bacillati bacterium ANGP1]|uniref:DNA mismatch repair protein MutS n=1 Tax=Candidatus Segetimicrobium genomatis TaxID=2569760 RepID=A0A537LZ63_9BACT|nr:MAG: DNA mismatch repair protein MutS [Terrabacteria group bacterium ANGP1]
MRRKELQTMRELTPMMRQYRSLKDQHPHAILLFRLGDFFEAFFEDAHVVARELQLTLTSRPVAKGRRIPMCGIPHHALHTYLRRLIDRGHRVAICDQVEDPRHAGALVRREVVRVVTPGTVVEDDLLSARENNFLAAVASRGDQWGAAFADLSTGEFFATQGDVPDHLHAALALWHPRELLVPDDPGAGVVMEDMTATAYDAERFDPPVAARALREHLGVATLDAFGLAEAPLATAAAGALVQYLRETQRGSLPHLRAIRFNPRSSGMVIDEATERALGLWSRGATLLSVLDLTETPMGARLLRRWLQQPLLDPAQITARLDAVDAFVPDAAAREALRARLKSLGDVERWSGRLAQAAGTPRDLAALRASLEALPAVAPIVARYFAAAIRSLVPALAVPPDLVDSLRRGLVEAPPLSPKDGGVIRPGFDPEIDRLHEGSRAAREWIAGLEASERARTGIRSLRVGYNQVMGYYIEVSKANEHLVPPDYVRKGTLVGAERYITAEMKEREALVLTAQERIAAREYEVFCQLRDGVRAQIDRLQAAARAVAELDVYAALAEAAVRHRYARPQLVEGRVLRIAEGRHPTVEQAIGGKQFVPNDVMLGADDRDILIVTGPNFGGKSTYIRQAALIVIMAQIGSFVPAREAEVGLVDRIFTRVGATDDLAAGRSTFLTEMIEVARILTQATPRSLVILDEVGRGTSTYDGMSLAWAVVEDLHDRVGARTLFATHYHELTELASQLARCANLQVLVREEGQDIVFLHRVAEGAAASSYGIHVARLAGVPEMVTHRAREVLAGLEASAASQRTPRKRGPSRGRQLALPLPSPVEEALRRADLARMTPLEALNFLSTLRTLVEQPGEGPRIADAPGAGPRPGGRQAGTVVPFPKSPGDPSRR